MNVKNKSKKPKKNFTSKEPEVFWHLNAKGEKLWGFRHRYYDTFGKRREKPKQGLASENIAIRELLKVKTELINGNTKRVDNSNLTISEWVDIWFNENERHWAISTQIRRKGIIKDQIKPLVGKYKLAKLDRSTYITKFINELVKSYETSSVKNFHNIFRIAINAAVDNEIIPRNRFSRIKIAGKEEDKVNENYLTAAELKEFLVFSKSNTTITNHTAMMLLAYTGLRKGEANGLRWKDIDFDSMKLTVERTRDRDGTRKPKTKNSYRTINISNLVVEQLKVYRKWCIEAKFSNGKKLLDDDFIFISNHDAKPISDDCLNKSFNFLAKKSNIKRITPHGMRHTHATILLTQSEPRLPVAVIAKRLGNSIQMINNVYGHVIEEIEVESVSSFDDAVNL
ncbi:tyrosine-type recombinase/integrase [Sporosarcina sp. FSL K6-5500]|uniref:tyrosine-type recombinase/integrase n=1 Tax=Sporosarcina sp. FSL K6-5500 TaxID=2921558 RepID=UPI0030F6F7C0